MFFVSLEPELRSFCLAASRVLVMAYGLKIPSRLGFALPAVNLNVEEGSGCFSPKRFISFVSRPAELAYSGHQSQIQTPRWYLGSPHEAFLFLEAALFQLILVPVR